MAETVFQNLRTRGTLAVVGVATLASIVVTGAITGTTGNFSTSLEAATISGTTINALQANGKVDALTLEGVTVSGTTINALQANGVVKARTVSGAALNLGGSGLGTDKVLCVKSTGAVGFYTRSATGTLTESTCQ